MRQGDAALRVAVSAGRLQDIKGALGPGIGRVGRRLIHLVANSRGLVVDETGKLHCPPVGPTANEFTDLQASTCIIPAARSAGRDAIQAFDRAAHYGANLPRRKRVFGGSRSIFRSWDDPLPDDTIGVGIMSGWIPPPRDRADLLARLKNRDFHGVHSLAGDGPGISPENAARARLAMEVLEREYPGLLDVANPRAVIFVQGNGKTPKNLVGQWRPHSRTLMVVLDPVIDGDLLDQGYDPGRVEELVEAMVHEIGHALSNLDPSDPKDLATLVKMGFDPATSDPADYRIGSYAIFLAMQRRFGGMFVPDFTAEALVRTITQWYEQLPHSEKQKWTYPVQAAQDFYDKGIRDPHIMLEELFGEAFMHYISDGSTGVDFLDNAIVYAEMFKGDGYATAIRNSLQRVAVRPEERGKTASFHQMYGLARAAHPTQRRFYAFDQALPTESPRLMAMQIDRALEILPDSPDESNSPGAMAARFKKSPDAFNMWRNRVGVALTRGIITKEQAKAIGYDFEGIDFDLIQPLEEVPYYHVTTRASGIANTDGRLLTRWEQGMIGAESGLGGGSNHSVSTTTSLDAAVNIYDTLTEAANVANGTISINDLLRRSREGDRGSKPFRVARLEEFAETGVVDVHFRPGRDDDEGLKGLWSAVESSPDGPLDEEAQKALRSYAVMRLRSMPQPRNGYERREAASLKDAVDHPERFSKRGGTLSHPPTPVEEEGLRWDIYHNDYLRARESANGPPNPILIQSEPDPFKIDPDDIQIGRYTPRPGAVGARAGDVQNSEVKVLSGEALDFAGFIDPESVSIHTRKGQIGEIGAGADHLSHPPRSRGFIHYPALAQSAEDRAAAEQLDDALDRLEYLLQLWASGDREHPDLPRDAKGNVVYPMRWDAFDVEGPVRDARIARALSMGVITDRTADSLGFRPAEFTEARQLNPDEPLYHVTTAAEDVIRGGGLLLTRWEQRKARNEPGGLGGSEDHTISLSTSRNAAENIQLGLRDAVAVARGDVQVREMRERAARGEFGASSFQEALDAAVREELGDEFADMFETGTFRRYFNPQHGLSWRDDLDEDGVKQWARDQLRVAAASGHVGPYDNGSYQGVLWTALLTEIAQGRAKIDGREVSIDLEGSNWLAPQANWLYYRAYFLPTREKHGGPTDPQIVHDNWQAVAGIDPESIQILEYRGKPKTFGMERGDSWNHEIQVFAGDALEFVGVSGDEVAPPSDTVIEDASLKEFAGVGSLNRAYGAGNPSGGFITPGRDPWLDEILKDFKPQFGRDEKPKPARLTYPIRDEERGTATYFHVTVREDSAGNPTHVIIGGREIPVLRVDTESGDYMIDHGDGTVGLYREGTLKLWGVADRHEADSLWRQKWRIQVPPKYSWDKRNPEWAAYINTRPKPLMGQMVGDNFGAHAGIDLPDNPNYRIVTSPTEIDTHEGHYYASLPYELEGRKFPTLQKAGREGAYRADLARSGLSKRDQELEAWRASTIPAKRTPDTSNGRYVYELRATGDLPEVNDTSPDPAVHLTEEGHEIVRRWFVAEPNDKPYEGSDADNLPAFVGAFMRESVGSPPGPKPPGRTRKERMEALDPVLPPLTRKQKLLPHKKKIAGAPLGAKYQRWDTEDKRLKMSDDELTAHVKYEDHELWAKIEAVNGKKLGAGHEEHAAARLIDRARRFGDTDAQIVEAWRVFKAEEERLNQSDTRDELLALAERQNSPAWHRVNGNRAAIFNTHGLGVAVMMKSYDHTLLPTPYDPEGQGDELVVIYRLDNNKKFRIRTVMPTQRVNPNLALRSDAETIRQRLEPSKEEDRTRFGLEADRVVDRLIPFAQKVDQPVLAVLDDYPLDGEYIRGVRRVPTDKHNSRGHWGLTVEDSPLRQVGARKFTVKDPTGKVLGSIFYTEVDGKASIYGFEGFDSEDAVAKGANLKAIRGLKRLYGEEAGQPPMVTMTKSSVTSGNRAAALRFIRGIEGEAASLGWNGDGLDSLTYGVLPDGVAPWSVGGGVPDSTPLRPFRADGTPFDPADAVFWDDSFAEGGLATMGPQIRLVTESPHLAPYWGANSEAVAMAALELTNPDQRSELPISAPGMLVEIGETDATGDTIYGAASPYQIAHALMRQIDKASENQETLFPRFEEVRVGQVGLVTGDSWATLDPSARVAGSELHDLLRSMKVNDDVEIALVPIRPGSPNPEEVRSLNPDASPFVVRFTGSHYAMNSGNGNGITGGSFRVLSIDTNPDGSKTITLQHTAPISPPSAPSSDFTPALNRSVVSEIVPEPTAILAGIDPPPRIPVRGAISTHTDGRHAPREIVNPAIPDIDTAVAHVLSGGSLSEVPNQFWAETLQRSSSRDIMDRDTPFYQAKVTNPGLVGTVNIYLARKSDGTPSRQGWVTKTSPAEEEAVNEVIAWNFMASVGIASESGGWGGLGSNPNEFLDAAGQVPIAVLPHVTNFVDDDADLTLSGTREHFDQEQFDNLPDMGLPARTGALLTGYAMLATDRHDNNLFSMVVDGTPVVVPIDFGFSGFGASGDFLEYATDIHEVDPVPGRSRSFLSSLEPDRARAIASDIFASIDQFIDRAEQFLDGSDEEIGTRMLAGIDPRWGEAIIGTGVASVTISDMRGRIEWLSENRDLVKSLFIPPAMIPEFFPKLGAKALRAGPPRRSIFSRPEESYRLTGKLFPGRI